VNLVDAFDGRQIDARRIVQSGAYVETRIVRLTDNALSPKQLARLAHKPGNSYFRRRLALLVETGRVRRTRRGYSRA